VLLLAQSTDGRALDSVLTMAPEISAVDVVRLETGLPTLDQLLGYDAVIAIAPTRFGDRDGIGNLLADYADLGGGVILTQAAFSSSSSLAGRLASGGYLPFDEAPPGFLNGEKLGVSVDEHPLMQGVRGLLTFPVTDLTLATGATLVSSWSLGTPCVATRRANVVGVNVSFGTADGWGGDGVRLLVNAVRWSCQRATWMSLDADRGVLASGASARVRVRASALRFEGDERRARILVHTDDPAATLTALPAHLQVPGAPKLQLDGGRITLFPQGPPSVFGGYAIPTPTRLGTLGMVDFRASGSFTSLTLGARVLIENQAVGRVGERLDLGCASLRRVFPIAEDRLGQILADGRIDLVVEPPRASIGDAPPPTA